MRVGRLQASWRGLAAVALALLGCATEFPDVEVTPPVPGVGEPIHVRARLGERRGAGMVRAELRDAAGELLSAAEVVTAAREDRLSLWLFPSASARHPLRLTLRDGRRSREVSVPLDLARPVARPRLLLGVHAEEGEGTGRYRWTGACLEGEIEDPGGDAVLHLAYSCAIGPERRVAVRIGGGPAQELPCGAAESARLPLARELWAVGPFVPLELEVEPPFVPGEVWGTSDSRELGVQLFAIAVAPAG